MIRPTLAALASAVLASLAGAPSARAQDGSAEETKAQQDALDRAKDLFRQGVVLFQAGSTEPALELFLRSREAYPSPNNTINAAICLERLARYDEALEMYEEVLRLHDTVLDDANRAGVHNTLRRLEQNVGTLRVSSNVQGALVIDGRLRGSLPMRTGLRLVPGKHVIRVLADGYATFEQTVDVRAGGSETLDARLERLTRSGGLRVEDPGAPGSEVYIDGAVVGVSPWEGTLAPGPHLVQTRSSAVGSAPVRAMVLERQTVLVRLTSKPLGPRHVFEVTPRTASLAVDGVPLGFGRWDGFLPVGRYELAADENGYFPQKQAIVVTLEHRGGQQVSLQLRVNEAHPRWPKPPTGHLWAGLGGGWALGGGLRSGAEGSCPGGCSSDPLAMGAMGRVHAGFELPVLTSIELAAGYLSLWRSIDREVQGSFAAQGAIWSVTYALQDKLRLRGPFVAGGASQRILLGSDTSFVGRLMVGAWFAKASNTVSGTAGGEPLSIANAGESQSATALMVMPELGAHWSFEPWSVSAGLAALFVPMEGPASSQGGMVASSQNCTLANPGAASCAPESDAIAGERAYGPLWMVIPQVGVSRRF